MALIHNFIISNIDINFMLTSLVLKQHADLYSFLFFSLQYILTVVFPPSIPRSASPNLFLRSTPPLPFRKKQTPQGYKPNME